MFRPVEMAKVHVLVLEKYVDAVTSALGASGLVHLVDAPKQSQQRLLRGVDPGPDLRELERLWQRAGSLLDQLGLERDAARPPDPPLSKEELRRIVDEMEARYTAEDKAINDLINESGLLVQTSARLDLYPFRSIRLSELRNLHHLYIATGRLRPKRLYEAATKLRDRALLLHEYAPETREERVLVLTSRKSRWAVESELSELGFQPEPVPEDLEESPEAEQERVQKRLDEIHKAVEDHRSAILRLKEESGPRLLAAWAQLGTMIAMMRARGHFGRTDQVYCISGWLPAGAIEQVRRISETASAGTAVVEVLHPEEDELVRSGKEQVPVQFPPRRALRPFQKLVTAYGVPRYEEVEPSLLMAFTFVFMFGMMFGDLGHGLVFAGIGLYLLKSRKPWAQRGRDVGWFLVFCGAAAALFGVFYDSFFGREGIVERLPILRAMVLVHPLQDVMVLFKVAVVVGVVCISAGVIINIINRLRMRQYLAGVLDKFGIIGLVFYWGSIGLGLKATVAGRISGAEVFFLMILPLALLFFKEPLEHLLARRVKSHGSSGQAAGATAHEAEEEPGGASMIFGALIEVMETLTTFLSNTVSFVRLAGFAMSHAALCIAVYTLADMIRSAPAGGMLAAGMIVVGNVFVMALEGMVVVIQGLRLHYYEIFSKFFAGDGVLYSPFRLAGAAAVGAAASESGTENRRNRLE